jgi:hypothetical protein
VRYLEGRESPTSESEWVGAFIAEPAIDGAFALAEPPTHDDWVPGILQRSPQKTFVNVALREIRNRMQEFMGSDHRSNGEGQAFPLGWLADQLAGLIAGTPGSGARGGTGDGNGDSGGGGRRGRGGQTGGRSGRGERARVEPVGEHRLLTVDGERVVEVDFEVIAARGSAATRVSARSDVVTQEGDLESDPPRQADLPRVIGWRNASGMRLGEMPTIDVPASGRQERWTVVVRVPDDTVVSISLVAESAPK